MLNAFEVYITALRHWMSLAISLNVSSLTCMTDRTQPELGMWGAKSILG
jgi:hypothetical protein